MNGDAGGILLVTLSAVTFNFYSLQPMILKGYYADSNKMLNYEQEYAIENKSNRNETCTVGTPKQSMFFTSSIMSYSLIFQYCCTTNFR